MCKPLDFYSFKVFERNLKKFLMLIPTGAPAEAQPNAAHGEKGYYKEIKGKQRTHTHTPNIHFLCFIYC